MPVELSIDQRDLQKLVAAFRAEADEKKLRRDLAKELRQAADPAVVEVRSSVQALTRVPSEAATQVASKVRVGVRLSGATGVKITIPRGAVPGFKNAAKAFDSRKGWRHPIFGRSAWVPQKSSAEYFKPSILHHAKEARQACSNAIKAMAKRISNRVGSG